MQFGKKKKKQKTKQQKKPYLISPALGVRRERTVKFTFFLNSEAFYVKMALIFCISFILYLSQKP